MSLPALPTSLPGADVDGSETDDGFDLTDAPLEAADEVTGLTESVGTHDLDLTALRSDDALLNALGNASSYTFGAATEPELNALLLSWRHDVDAEPLPELVDTETAMHTIFAAAHRNRRKPRFLVPLASAAAVLVIVFTGVGLAARDAQPGDALWGLTQVLYSDHARSVVAADAVRTELSHASAALNEGHYGAARNALAQAQQTLPSVDNEDGQADLQAQQQNLLNQLAQSTGSSQLPTTITMPSQDSISATLLPSTTPSSPTSESPTPPTSTTTTAPPTSTTPPTSSPPDPSSPALQSGTVSNSDGGTGTGGTDTGNAGSNLPDGGSSSDSPS